MNKAFLYQENWEYLVNQDKILIVPVPDNTSYALGNKLNIYFKVIAASLPPIAISPTIKKQQNNILYFST
ncbi:hypothetical protein [Bacillus sp. JAS24-2]|uniref:hypothetical protein n=1 Tax=Bacillus sp. JAS24-2 TaxID=2217832 RepID=UPI003242999E